MAIDSDDPIALPTPPPPRPAARRDAMEAALRKFDGVEEASPGRKVRKKGGWAAIQQRQLGALATAALILVVGVPVALITLREQTPHAPAPNVLVDRGPPACPGGDCAQEPQVSSQEQPAKPGEAGLADISRPAARVPVTALVPIERRGDVASVADELKAVSEAPAPVAAAAPPPPPPPPPAPAPERSEQYAAEAPGQDMVVTGSRIRSTELNSQNDARVVGRRIAKPSPVATSEPHRAFLSRLQDAVRADDKRGVIGLTGFPLRVNRDGRTRTYRSARELERDFDSVFTPRVRQAILSQRADRLFINYQGAMIGDGQVWFDQSCPNSSCSPAGPMRIRAVNP